MHQLDPQTEKRDTFTRLLGHLLEGRDEGRAMDGSEQRGCSSLVVSVAGRDALPVRALPYVTGWLISPDIVASNFARSETGASELLKSTDSYHLVGERVVKLLPKEWDRYVVALRALSAELHEQFADYDQGYAAWRRSSVAKLPAGAFVWLDEFVADFTEDYSPGRRAIAGEREGDREVNLSPYLEPEVLEMALAGWLYSRAEPPLAHGVEGTQDESPRFPTASCNTNAVTATKPPQTSEQPRDPAQIDEATPTKASNGSVKVWTDERKNEVKAYRAIHGLKKTAEYYKVSQATISKHVPAGKAKPKKATPFGGLGGK